MFDVSVITSYIDIILSYIFDHIGIAVGILIVLLSIRSSRKKKRRAQAENNGETPKAKSLREIMAEMETELNKADDNDEVDVDIEEEAKEAEPTARPYGEQGSMDSPWQQRETTSKRTDTPWASQAPAPEGPGAERLKPPALPGIAASAPFGENPLPKGIHMPIEAPPMEVQRDAEECGGNGYFRKKKFNRGELIDAVVMAEILAKPKSLRKAGQRL